MSACVRACMHTYIHTHTPCVSICVKLCVVCVFDAAQRVEGLRQVVVPRDLTYRFLLLANSNTAKGIETCGVLCGRLVRHSVSLFWGGSGFKWILSEFRSEGLPPPPSCVCDGLSPSDAQ